MTRPPDWSRWAPASPSGPTPCAACALGVAEPCCARARSSVHRGALAAWRHAGLRAHATLLRRSRRAGHLRHARRRTARAARRAGRGTRDLSRRLESLSQDAGGVALRFRDGAEARADLLIGADGLRSTVNACCSTTARRAAGYGAWLGLSDTDHPRLSRESAVEIYGAGERLGVIDSGDGLYYWYFIENRAQPVDGVVHAPPAACCPGWRTGRTMRASWPRRRAPAACNTCHSFTGRPAAAPGAGTARCCWATPSIPTCPTWGKAPARPSRTRMCWASCWRKGWRISPLLTRYQSAGAHGTACWDAIRSGWDVSPRPAVPHRAACATWRCAACPIGARAADTATVRHRRNAPALITASPGCPDHKTGHRHRTSAPALNRAP